MICPVCGRKVGAWHASGIHPGCAKKRESLPDAKGPVVQVPKTQEATFVKPTNIFDRTAQTQRDAILRNINRSAR